MKILNTHKKNELNLMTKHDGGGKKLYLGQIVCENYKLLGYIGRGSFGIVYSALDITNETTVAVKVEHVSAKPPQLESEYKLYKRFLDSPNSPKAIFFGMEGDYRVFVLELLGRSLEDIYAQSKKAFSLKTVLMLAEQMISAIEYIHNKHIIHRDIKPDNFMMGANNNENIVYLIDYGLAKEYRNPDTLEIIKFREGLSLTGTARYASINALKGCEQSRRDDLESLGYVLIYLLKGSLPWQGLPAQTCQQKYAKILETKQNTSLDSLCKGLPNEFIQYLIEVRKLGFQEKPDYAGYRRLFRDVLLKNYINFDYVYDWSLQRSRIQKSANNMSASPRLRKKSENFLKESMLPSLLNRTGRNQGVQDHKVRKRYSLLRKPEEANAPEQKSFMFSQLLEPGNRCNVLQKSPIQNTRGKATALLFPRLSIPKLDGQKVGPVRNTG